MAGAEPDPKVVISAGFHRLHLPIAAREASDRGLLALAIVAAYPTARARRVLDLLHLSGRGRVARLMQRDTNLPEDRVRALPTPELLDEAARLLERVPVLKRLYPRLAAATFRLYGRRAARHVGRADARVFHFRAGFGGASIDRARAAGMAVLCDHAIVHPAFLEELVENHGRLRRGRIGEPAAGPIPPPPDAFWEPIVEDMERSDAAIVNSDFVKQSMITAGWPPDRVHVVYLGVDDNFLTGGEPIRPRREWTERRLPLLFASRFEQRKGAETMIEAVRLLEDHGVDWELVIAGPVEEEVRAAHADFFTGDRVRVLGPLSRPEFKRQLLSLPVFVFPSHAEGSARAVFEALACGCYTITTPNAGSIVEDGVHGTLVPPGDPAALAAAIAAADRDRERVAEIGNRNIRTIAERHTQARYGEELVEVYRRVAAAHAA